MSPEPSVLSPLKWVAALAVLLLILVGLAEGWSDSPAPDTAQSANPAPRPPPARLPATPLPDDDATPQGAPDGPTLRGRVVDAQSSVGIAGARVTLQGQGGGVETDAVGAFVLPVRSAGGSVMVSAVGFLPSEPVVASDKAPVLVRLTRTTLLRVTVVTANGQKAAQARVEVSPPQPANVSTSRADGVALFPGLKPGAYRLFARSQDGTLAATGEAAVARNQHTLVTLTLSPASYVEGVVLEADNVAAGGATLWVESDDGSQLGSGVAGADGVFVLRGLASSEGARVHAVKGGRHGRSDVVKLPRGAGTRGVRITLGKGGNGIAGSVLDEDGAPVAGANVDLAPGWQGGEAVWASTVSDGEGRFAFESLEDGRYDVTARFGDQEAVLDEVKPGARGVVLQLFPGAMVEGRVVDDVGQPVPAFHVRAEFARDVAPGGESGRVRRGSDKSADVNNAAGTFRLGAMRRGQYDVEVTTTDGRIGRAQGTVNGRQGANVGDIKVTGSGMVIGRVTDKKGGGPIAGASVQRWQRGSEPAITGPDGRFSLQTQAGPVMIWVEHPGYFSKRLMVGAVNVGATVDVGEVPLVGGSRREIEGRQGFGGVGATLRDEHGNVVVEKLMEDGPGLRMGLKKGDVILSVDGEDLTGKGVQEAISNIRGESGSTTWLKVRRNGEELTVPVRREPINVEGR